MLRVLLDDEMTLRVGTLLSSFVACAVFLASSPAWATWTSFEYRNRDGAYRYGIKDGSSKVRLGLRERKQADKTASAMNDAEELDESKENAGRKKRRRGDNKSVGPRWR